MMPRFPAAKRQAAFIGRYHRIILLSVLALMTLAYPLFRGLSIKANLLELLPDHVESVQSIDRLTEIVGGTSYLIAVVEGANLETVSEAAARFSRKVKDYPGIEGVSFHSEMGVFQKYKLLFLSREGIARLKDDIRDLIDYYRRKNNPFFIDLQDKPPPELNPGSYPLGRKAFRLGGFHSGEIAGSMQIIMMQPSHFVADFEKTRAMLAVLRDDFDQIRSEMNEPVRVNFTGSYKTRLESYETIMGDLRRTSLLAFFLVTLLLVLFFRNFRSVLFAYVSLGIGIYFTGVFAAATIGYLNVISAFLLIVLFGLGIDFAIHLLSRLEYARRETGSFLPAVTQVYHEIGRPLLASALTTSIAFFSLTISSFQGFRHFGWIAGTGILICWLTVFYGLPALGVLGEKIRAGNWSPKRLPHPVKGPKAALIWTVLILGVVFSAVSLSQVNNLRFEYDFEELQPEDFPALELSRRIDEWLGVRLNPIAVITKDDSEARELSARLNQKSREREDSMIDFAASIFSMVPQHQDEKIRQLREIDEMLAGKEALIQRLDESDRERIRDLRSRLQTSKMTVEDLPDNIHRQYRGKHEDVSIVYIYPARQPLNGRNAKAWVSELNEAGLPQDVKLAGGAVVFADILTRMERDTPAAIFLSLTAVIILLFFYFRSLLSVVLILAPVALTFLWSAGIAGLTGFSFNFFNVTILPALLGVGIDAGIHIMHRYQRERQTTFAGIMVKTGKAIGISLITTSMAFVSLGFAEHRGVASLGHLGVIGFFCCLIASTVFVPSLIEFFELSYWRVFRSRNSSSFSKM